MASHSSTPTKLTPALKDLQKVSLGDVRFPFGFFLVDEGNKTYVIPGTLEDRRETLRKAFPNIHPLSVFAGCFPNSDGPGCHGGCGGFPAGYRCMRMVDDNRRYYSCGCVDMS